MLTRDKKGKNKNSTYRKLQNNIMYKTILCTKLQFIHTYTYASAMPPRIGG